VRITVFRESASVGRFMTRRDVVKGPGERLNIWIVHPTAGGPSIGRHWRPYWLADAWNRMGHDTTVICSNFHHLMQQPRRSPGLHRIEDVDFWFVPTARYNGNGPGRFISMLSFRLGLAHEFKKLLILKPPDIIIASVPHFFHVQLLKRLARRRRIPFWVEVRDLWPLSLTTVGNLKSWNPLVKLISIQEKRAYSSADLLISLLANAEQHMVERGLQPGRFVWIPNGVSSSEMSSALNGMILDHPIIRHILDTKATGKKIVLYAGAMGEPNALDVLIDAASILSTSAPDIHFILVGRGESRKRLMSKAASHANVEFFDEVSRPVAQSALSAIDCAVVTFHKSYLYDHGISPNKLFDYCLCAPRAVIACDQSSLSGLESLALNRCEPNNSVALARCIEVALSEPARSAIERCNAVMEFSYTNLATRYLESGISSRLPVHPCANENERKRETTLLRNFPRSV